jgi:hypothetical protein
MVFNFDSLGGQGHKHYIDWPGTDVMILKIFSPKNRRQNWRFLLKTKLNYANILIITLVFEKNANFLPKIVKNRRKL